MDFSFINLLQRDWAIGPSGTPQEGDPPTCLMLCPAKDFHNVPDDTLMESAVSGEKKTKAEVAKMDDESRFSVFASAEILAWGIRPEPQKGVFFNGKFVETHGAP